METLTGRNACSPSFTKEHRIVNVLVPINCGVPQAVITTGTRHGVIVVQYMADIVVGVDGQHALSVAKVGNKPVREHAGILIVLDLEQVSNRENAAQYHVQSMVDIPHGQVILHAPKYAKVLKHALEPVRTLYHKMAVRIVRCWELKRKLYLALLLLALLAIRRNFLIQTL